MTRPACAHIELGALQHNLTRVRQMAPESRIIAVIKANAYGHGLVQVAQALDAADAFGVVGLDEAINLREAGCEQRIVLLEGLFSAADIALVCGYRLDLVIHNDFQLDLVEQGQLTRPVDVWLKIDTGMHRLGFAPAGVDAALARLQALQHIGTVRYMTHFARADEADADYTASQIATFQATLGTRDGERTLANSAAVLAWPAAHADWVRPGIMLYGSSPIAGKSAAQLDLRPAMSLCSKLIAVAQRRKGDAVGYGGDWACPEDMQIGVAAIGYGDGYPRHAPPGTPVLVNGQRAALAGRVSMDMICIDLRNCTQACIGDEVIVWGDGLPVDDIACAAGTIAYEMLSGVSSRVQYHYR
ncbi:MAG TPA: alanine racemase [Gammaproteobacteria bacterium]|nr:alanine racemase [Gammaproteobacteria bacterium]